MSRWVAVVVVFQAPHAALLALRTCRHLTLPVDLKRRRTKAASSSRLPAWIDGHWTYDINLVIAGARYQMFRVNVPGI
jgi:hypothetical protein